MLLYLEKCIMKISNQVSLYFQYYMSVNIHWKKKQCIIPISIDDINSCSKVLTSRYTGDCVSTARELRKYRPEQHNLGKTWWLFTNKQVNIQLPNKRIMIKCCLVEILWGIRIAAAEMKSGTYLEWLEDRKLKLNKYRVFHKRCLVFDLL